MLGCKRFLPSSPPPPPSYFCSRPNFRAGKTPKPCFFALCLTETLATQAIKELNEAFYHFLWDGKPNKIKRNVIINKYSDGGLKMIDLFSFNKSLKTIWIKKYLDKTDMGKWKGFFDLKKNHFQTSDIFVNEILLIWAEVNFNNSIFSLEQYKTQRLWNNSLIRIDRKPVYFRECGLAKGILTVESLIKDGTSFLSYTEFLNKYHCKSCPLAFSGIFATLKAIRKRFKENIDSLETVEVESFTKAFQKTKKPSNLTYRNLVAKKRVKNRELPKQNGSEIATSMRKK